MADEVENPAAVEESAGGENDSKGFMEEVMAEVTRRSPEETKEVQEEEGAPKESEEQQPEESKGKEEEKKSDEAPAVEADTVDPTPAPDESEQKQTDKNEENEDKKEETSEITEDEPRTNEGKELSSPKPAPEKKKRDKKIREPVEQIVVPHLLSDEAVSEKGVPVTEMENYKRFYLKQAFAPKTWYESLKDNTFETNFLTLDPKEIDLLLAMYHSPTEDQPELSDNQKEVLEGLKRKIETMINEYGDAGAFLRLNTKAPTDAILERNDCDYVQSMQEDVTTEMEIENQFANAYLIWRSWRSSSFRETETQPRANNVLRRSLRRIQKSFRPATGGRRQSSGKEEDNSDPLAEETKKDDDTKEDGGKEEAMPKDEATPTTEPTAEGPLTVEATIESPQADAAPEESESESAKKTETQNEPAPETSETETQTVPAETSETETQTAQTETENVKTQTGDDAEITAQDGEKGEEEGKEKEEKGEDIKRKDSTPKSLTKETTRLSEEHQMIKVKQETLQNKVLRAFMRNIVTRYRVTNGEEAIKLLTTSSIIKEELEQVKKFEEVEGTEAVVAIIKWISADISRYPGMNFRAFVYNNKLTAVTQHDDIFYVPNIARFKKTILGKIQFFFDNDLKPAMEKESNYIVDLFLAPNKVFVTELHPFHQSTGACLFTWQQSQKLLMEGGGEGAPLELHHVHTPFKKCFGGLLPHWQTVCETVTQNKRAEEDASGNKCVIL